MFGRQRERLRRTRWEDINEFAEELYAMLDPKQPLTHEGPITLLRRGNTPFITFGGAGEDDSLFQINGRSGELVDVVTPEGLTTPQAGDTQQGSSSQQVFMGTIISGSGATYTVQLDTGAQVTVTQGQILATDTIPAGTVAVVVKKTSGTYAMQVPVWV